MATDLDHLAHLKRIATPSRMGQYIAPRFMGRPYNVYPWVTYIENRILTMLNEPGRKILIISVPPQEGKTTYCGMFLPAWYLGMNPDHQVLFIAYSEGYAGKWGLKTRNVIEQFGRELFGITLSSSATSQIDWSLANGFGGMLSAGIMGGITGNPGHLILIDDVIKTMEDANSTSAKQKHLDEWDGSIYSRFQENTKVVLTATRWAEDDLSGALIARSKLRDYSGPPIEVIEIKAFAEPSEDEEEAMTDEELEAWRDCLGRPKGEHLQGQHSRGFFLEKMPPSTDLYAWSAQYQANPSVRVGGMFPREDWRYYTPATLPEMNRRVRVWDLAATEGGGDWTVGLLMGRGTDGYFYVLDMERFQKGPGGVRDAVLRVAASDGYDIPILIEQERSGTGKSTIETYQTLLVGYRVYPAKAEGSKQSRANSYSAEQNKNHVFLPDGATWVPAFIDEHRRASEKRWPRHDDQIDTGAYGILDLIDSGPVEIWDPSDFNPDAEQQMESLLVRHAYG